MKTGIRLIALVALLVASVAHAQSTDEIAEKIRKAHSSMKDYEATFTQEVTGAGRTQNASGTLYIRVPDQMRWDYLEPKVKSLITDGKTSWMVLPEEKQVYEQPMSEGDSTKTPLGMLTGKLDFRAEYDIERLPDADGRIALRLTPKSEGRGFKEARVEVDAKSFEIQRFRLEDLYGGVTDVRLSNARKNAGLKASLFDFKPEKGFEVVKTP